MSQELLKSVRSPMLDRLTEAIQQRETACVCGLQEAQAAFIASRIRQETGKRVLAVYANDLKATHAAEDAVQLLGRGVACLPGGELDLTRGASSQ